MTPAVCVHYDHIITKAIVAKDEDFKDYVNRDSKVTHAPPSLETLYTAS